MIKIFIKIWYIFLQENASENDVCKIAVFLNQPLCVNSVDPFGDIGAYDKAYYSN